MLLPLLNTINADQLTKMNRADPMDTVNPLVARLIDVEKPSPPAPDSDGGYCFCLNAGYADAHAASTSTWRSRTSDRGWPRRCCCAPPSTR